MSNRSEEEIRKELGEKFDRVWFDRLVYSVERLESAKAGRELSALLARKLRDGSLTDKQRDWIASALERVAEGDDPREVLGVKRGRGKKEVDPDQVSVSDRDRLLALEADKLVESGYYLTRNEATEGVESACSLLSEKYGVDEAYIAKRHRDHFGTGRGS